MKKILNKLYIVLMVMVLPIIQVNAATGSGQIFNNPLSSGPKDIYGLIAVVVSFVSKLGAAVVIMYVIYSGFLFVKAQGDIGELEKARKTFFWTVIGGVILLGASVLAAVIQNTAKSLGA